jgi:hypothetical protein
MDMRTETIRPGRYRHYKGNDYEVIGVARHSETEEGWWSTGSSMATARSG